VTHIPDDAARHPVRSFAPAGEHWKSLEALDTHWKANATHLLHACSDDRHIHCLQQRGPIVENNTRRIAGCWDYLSLSVAANLKFQTQCRSQAALLQGEVLCNVCWGSRHLAFYFSATCSPRLLVLANACGTLTHPWRPITTGMLGFTVNSRPTCSSYLLACECEYTNAIGVPSP
jgi:hypothetical protein